MYMSMRFRLGPARPRLWLVLALSSLLAGCQGPCSKIEPITGPASSGGPTNYVAAGTSISAGWQSGGLVDRHQIRAFPAIFARQIGKTVQSDGRGTFTQPVYDHDGFPRLLEIRNYSPLVINNTNPARATGNPINLSQATAYHDMAVPFAIAFDFVDTTYYYTQATPPFRPDVAMTLFDNIARRRGSIAQQVLSLAPDFITWEYGSNEVLGPVTQGAGADPATAETFAAILAGSLNAIHAALPNARIAVFTIPGVAAIPFATTLSPFTVSLANGQPLPLVGVDGPLQVGDLVLLTASTIIATTGTGIPAGGYNYLNPSVPSNGQPLPENLILRGPEIAATQTEVSQMNAAIAAEVAARSYVALVDFHGLLQTIAANGLTIGGTQYTTAYIRGGLFSLDGVHPNDLAHAVMCNALIDAVNARFGSAIRRVNPTDWATASSSAARPEFGEGPLAPRVEGLEDVLPRPVPAYIRLQRLP